MENLICDCGNNDNHVQYGKPTLIEKVVDDAGNVISEEITYSEYIIECTVCGRFIKLTEPHPEVKQKENEQQ